jgi:centromeric protein E
VDLAGSEKVSIHDHYFKKRDKSAGHYTSSPASSSSNYNSVFKDRVNESKHINKSLFFLTQVISLKSQGKPY